MVLVIGVYAEREASTERRFLPILVRRTLEDILLLHGSTGVDILDPIWVKLPTLVRRQNKRQKDLIVKAAEHCSGYHLLIIHADADDSTDSKAYTERILPGLELAQQEVEQGPIMVPVIPVYSTDAWMIVDSEALGSILGAKNHNLNLILPQNPKDVENDRTPKYTLQQAIDHIQQKSARRRAIDFESIHSPLAEKIDLQRLRLVPAYAKFVRDLTKALSHAGFIRIAFSP